MTLPANPKPTQQPTPPVRILCAEDDTSTLAFLEGNLTWAGFAVTTAPDGVEAWEALQCASFDLLLTDYQMPRLNGLELATQARTAGMALPIIIVTGCVERLGDSAEQQLNVRVLAKPFTLEELLQAVAIALDGATGVIGGTPR